MIDKVRREKLALHLRQYVSCRFNNQQLEDRIANDVSDGWLPEQYYRSKNTDCDSVIMPMLEHIWCLYDDTRFHRARKKYAIKGEVREQVARWILFLHSDLEYQWPLLRFTDYWFYNNIKFSRWLRYINPFYNRVKVRIDKAKQEWENFQKVGDFNYWPFINKDTFEAELKRPPYLNGKRTS
ncbi:MAG: hypothetical protein NTW55_07075 [Planctomycetota bacterium]|nr:hypothetical protein [Planctomycetota bacterium]